MSKQPALDFFRPASVLWQPSSHASFTGAQAAEAGAASQAVRILAVIRRAGPICQAHLVSVTGLPINVVTARVRALVQAGDVVADGFKTMTWRGGRQTKRTLWRVTTAEERDCWQRTQATLEA